MYVTFYSLTRCWYLFVSTTYEPTSTNQLYTGTINNGASLCALMLISNKRDDMRVNDDDGVNQDRYNRCMEWMMSNVDSDCGDAGTMWTQES
jgi:hypothetical protein